MLPTDRSNARIMDGFAGDFPSSQNVTQLRPVARQLAEHTERRRLHPRFDLFNGFGKRRRRLKKPRMCHNA